MAYQKIIVAFDGSENSVSALEHGMYFAREHKAELTVVNVVKKLQEADVKVSSQGEASLKSDDSALDNVNPETPQFESKKEGKPEVHTKKLQAKAGEALKDAEDQLQKENIQAKIVALEGDAAEEIDHYASENEADLIVIGHRGLSGLKKIVLGSITQKVIEKTSCPVLVVKE